jgi:acylphosphatase
MTTSRDEDRCALHAFVSGRVQGVFFRQATRQEAQARGLVGWVRNLPDGRVEALFIGSRTACERALAFVRTGPPAAAVTGVEFAWESPPNETPPAFSIR